MIRHVRPLDATVLLRNTPGFPPTAPRGRGEDVARAACLRHGMNSPQAICAGGGGDSTHTHTCSVPG